MNCKNVLFTKYHKSAFVTLKWAKIGDLGAKIAHFLLNAQNASICIRMHQNVCRMNCAFVDLITFKQAKIDELLFTLCVCGRCICGPNDGIKGESMNPMTFGNMTHPSTVHT